MGTAKERTVVTATDLTKTTAKSVGVTQAVARDVIQAFIAAVEGAVGSGADSVMIRGLATIDVKAVGARRRRVPGRGEVELPPGFKLRFVPSVQLRGAAKARTAEGYLAQRLA